MYLFYGGEQRSRSLCPVFAEHVRFSKPPWTPVQFTLQRMAVLEGFEPSPEDLEGPHAIHYTTARW